MYVEKNRLETLGVVLNSMKRHMGIDCMFRSPRMVCKISGRNTTLHERSTLL